MPKNEFLVSSLTQAESDICSFRESPDDSSEHLRMSNVAGFKCVECGREHSLDEVEYVCPPCGGNLDVLYDYQRVRAKMGKAQLEADRNQTMWRYRALLPIADTSSVPSLTVGWTPIYDCTHLAERYAV